MTQQSEESEISSVSSDDVYKSDLEDFVINDSPIMHHRDENDDDYVPSQSKSRSSIYSETNSSSKSSKQSSQNDTNAQTLPKPILKQEIRAQTLPITIYETQTLQQKQSILNKKKLTINVDVHKTKPNSCCKLQNLILVSQCSTCLKIFNNHKNVNKIYTENNNNTKENNKQNPKENEEVDHKLMQEISDKEIAKFLEQNNY